MIERGEAVKVKTGYGTACDGMEGVVLGATDFFSVLVKFQTGEVILPTDSLEEL